MRRLCIIIALFFSTATAVYAVSSVRYDFSNGQPTVVEDTTDAVTPVFDFSNGQPTIMEQFQNAATTGAVTTTQNTFIFEEE